mmetsp:Transcript_19022/g.43757  ORF Transcript_19022/g.43757 Transcript_19022/m.43757 type:complete len:101 (-) Transcript_19022:310-612(-)
MKRTQSVSAVDAGAVADINVENVVTAMPTRAEALQALCKRYASARAAPPRALSGPLRAASRCRCEAGRQKHRASGCRDAEQANAHAARAAFSDESSSSDL